MSLSSREELEIVRLHARYARAVSCNDIDGYADLFTDDAIWERKRGAPGTPYDTPLRVEGRDAIRKLLSDHPVEKATQYISANSVVDGDQNHADASSTLLVVKVASSGYSIVVIGTCEDVFEKTATGWKFRYRGISLLSESGPA